MLIIILSKSSVLRLREMALQIEQIVRILDVVDRWPWTLLMYAIKDEMHRTTVNVFKRPQNQRRASYRLYPECCRHAASD